MDPSLTQLPLPRAIFRLAWPAMTSMMLINLFNIVDAYWVGKLGTDALGGMTASAFLFWCIQGAGLMVGTGVNALVARRVGQGDVAGAAAAGGHGLLLAAGLAVLVMAVTLPLQRSIFGAMALSQPVLEAAVAYMTPVLWGFPVIICWYAVEAIYRGSGDTRTPMRVLSLALVFNVLLDPLLIFGLGPLPGLGLAGAAWATVLSHLVGVIAALHLIAPRPTRPRLGRVLDHQVMWILIRIGTPIAVTSVLFSVTYLFMTPIISGFGDPAVAAIGVGHRVEGFAFFTCVGFSTAAATLVGQHMGAGNPDQAARAAWVTTGISTGLILVLSAAFFLGAPQIFALFSDDAAVIEQGTSYLRIIAVFEFALALELVLEGAFGGAGNSLPPMIVGVPITALRVPLAYLLSRGGALGVQGIWWAISLTTLLKGAVLAIWFRAGRWKRVELLISARSCRSPRGSAAG